MAKKGRVVSARIDDKDSEYLDACGLTDTEMVRYGIMRHRTDKGLSLEKQLLLKISLLRDKIEDCELKIDAYSLLIQKKVDELVGLRDEKYYFIVNNVYEIYKEFLGNDSLSEEFRSDLLNFYDFESDRIESVAWKTKSDVSDVIRAFEEYVQFVEMRDSVAHHGVFV